MGDKGGRNAFMFAGVVSFTGTGWLHVICYQFQTWQYILLLKIYEFYTKSK